ncbi:N-acetyltransferase family protein [Luteococcus sp. Sow4_B9]|uniref:GNAT family N-acetyltransferase n=1 Tax=Luteococcus sp. Sow4_B9 TaxID=3438792 RepID=UPI003F972073
MAPSAPLQPLGYRPPRLQIRAATHEDLPVITEIYNEAGVGTTASYDLEPVSVENRRVWLDERINGGTPVLVAEDDGTVLGYASYGTFRDKAGYAHTVEHSVYVARGARALGVGRMLMLALIDRARGDGVHAMIGVLDADNEASVHFHEKLGFVEVGRLPQVGRKFDRWLDAVFMQLTFPAADPGDEVQARQAAVSIAR